MEFTVNLVELVVIICALVILHFIFFSKRIPRDTITFPRKEWDKINEGYKKRIYLLEGEVKSQQRIIHGANRGKR
jgi:hypothetical protein